MSKSKEITTAETSAWLIGQYVLAQNLVESFVNGDDLDAVLNQCIKQMAESARENGNMSLFFSLIALKQQLGEASKA